MTDGNSNVSQIKPIVHNNLGKYVYCIVEGELEHKQFGNIGINDFPVYSVSSSGVSAIVSDINYGIIDPSLEQVMTHQRVVDEVRKESTTLLPVRFGVIIKGQEGIKKLLQNSAEQYKEKMVGLKGKNEFGVKVMLKKEDVAKLRQVVENESKNIQKIKDEISSSEKGRAHFMKMKLDDALRAETMKKIEHHASAIHQELAAVADKSTLLKSDVNELVLNASYLLEVGKGSLFENAVEELKKKYRTHGFTFHLSGPWAPYSFC